MISPSEEDEGRCLSEAGCLQQGLCRERAGTALFRECLVSVVEELLKDKRSVQELEIHLIVYDLSSNYWGPRNE